MIIKECIDFVVNILLIFCGICLVVILGSGESTKSANGFLWVFAVLFTYLVVNAIYNTYRGK